jgi:hypothetical protein
VVLFDATHACMYNLLINHKILPKTTPAASLRPLWH